MSKFGEALARYRDEAGLNQRELGAAIGLDSTQVNKIERGHRPPLGAKYMKPLVRALRLNEDEALNLLDLAGLSPKVLEDDVQTPVHPRRLRKKAGKFKPGSSQAARGSASAIPSGVQSALSIADSVLYITFEQIEALIKYKDFSDEQMRKFAAGLLESAEMLSKVIKAPKQGVGD